MRTPIFNSASCSQRWASQAARGTRERLTATKLRGGLGPPWQQGNEPCDGNATIISSSYNVVKAQTVYAVVTLYQTRGDQLSQYGYAAFGLTVTPYALMPVIYLLGNLARPSYQTMFMVEYRATPHVSGIEKTIEPSIRSVDGKVIIGVVETLEEASRKHGRSTQLSKTPQTATAQRQRGQWLRPKHWRHWIEYGAILGCAAVQVSVVGALSSFRSGSSPGTSKKGAWILAWLIAGYFLTKLIDNGGGDIFRRIRRQRCQHKLKALASFDELSKAVQDIHGKLRDNRVLESVKDGGIREKLYKSLVNIPNIGGGGGGDRNNFTDADNESDNSCHDDGVRCDELLAKGMRQLHSQKAKLCTVLNDPYNDVSVGGGRSDKGNGRDTKDRQLARLVDPTQKAMAAAQSEFLSMRDNVLELKRDVYEGPARMNKERYLRLVMYALSSVPAIRGFVVVVQMIQEYGVCDRIT
ncbi:hypothetical protein MFIFM68171_08652 [Madurella fahalii]|uniref:Uncharacterized protein n=1 Tax=Madurella fahalii TaxID=1157608 RepID=A0ABQ0GL01_9PEZI